LLDSLLQEIRYEIKMNFYGSSVNVTSTPTRNNSFSTSSSSLDQSVGRVSSSSSSLDTPHGLKPLSRSPREILDKKEQMAKIEGKRVNSKIEKLVRVRSMTPEGDGKKNMMEELKMFYAEIIDDLKGVTQAADDGTEFESTLAKNLRLKQKEVEILRKKVAIVDMKKKDKQDELEMMKREIECLELVMKEEEKSHVDILVSLQTKIKSCLEEISKVSPSATSATDFSLYSKVFPCPPPPMPTPTKGGLLEFSNLFCLSGQLVQFCQGEYGSKLVMDRIRSGTDPERNLVREELDLPRSLGLLMEAGNKYCKDVVLALVERDMKTRVEVMGRVRRDKEIFARIEGGPEFMQRLLNIVGKVNK